MIRSSAFAICFLALQACSNDPASSDNDDSGTEAAFPASSSEELQSTLDGVVAAGVAPGVSLSVQHPSYQKWSGAAGVADIETGTALTAAQRFRAGSMLKTMVATAVLQLVEQGELSIDQNLTELLPPAITTRIPDAQAITVHMLLGHTSGIPEFSTPEFDAAVGADPMHVWTLDELLDRALAQPPMFAPGTGFSYTNTGYILLGEIIEAVTGQSWRATLRERVFARAELENTALPQEGDPLCNGCTRGYLPIDDQLLDVTEVDPSMAGPAGGDALISTPDDLVKFFGALASDQLFDDPSTLALMIDFIDAPNPEEAQTGYGLGVARFQLGEVEFVGHLGGTAGFQGFLFLHPGTGIVASGYMNQNGDFGAFIVPVLDAIARVE